MDNIDGLLDLIKILTDRINNTEMKYNMELEQRDKEIQSLQDRLYKIEDKKAKTAKNEFNSSFALDDAKDAFIVSRPHDRIDAFKNFELVFWYSYLIKDTEYREKLTSWAEVKKREKRIKELVNFYIKYALENGVQETDSEHWARMRVKNFIEYVVITVKFADGSKTFWGCVSDWAVNTYGHNIAKWQTEREIIGKDRKSLDE